MSLLNTNDFFFIKNLRSKVHNIRTNMIVNKAITNAKIADNTITNVKLADATIQLSKIGFTNYCPTGCIIQYAGTTAPSGWLLCNGSAISRTTYSDLYDVIGIIYGSGDGSTTFNLPNLQRKFPIGSSSLYAVGTTGGAETKTLTVDEIPSHSHNVVYNSGLLVQKTGGGTPGSIDSTSNEIDNINTISNSISIENTGGGQEFSIMPPYLTLNYIIKI